MSAPKNVQRQYNLIRRIRYPKGWITGFRGYFYVCGEVSEKWLERFRRAVERQIARDPYLETEHGKIDRRTAYVIVDAIRPEFYYACSDRLHNECGRQHKSAADMALTIVPNREVWN
jgi:hypothetical protein